MPKSAATVASLFVGGQKVALTFCTAQAPLLRQSMMLPCISMSCSCDLWNSLSPSLPLPSPSPLLDVGGGLSPFSA